jgi:GxxExxY protein
MMKDTDSPQRRRERRGGAEKIAFSYGQRMRVNEITREVIGAAIAVHRVLGPGLLESAYQECLCQELFLRGIPFERQVPLPLEYRGIRCECGYRLDLLVARVGVVEIKSIEVIAPIHEAQLLTYLRLGGWRVGLLMNFNVVVLKDGIRRKVLGLRE